MNKHRLSKNVIPKRYELSLDVDLDNFSYSGNEVIFIDVKKSTTIIQLNAAELTIDKCFIRNKDKNKLGAEVVYEEKIECITFIFSTENKRSLNLASSVAIVLSEFIRQTNNL